MIRTLLAISAFTAVSGAAFAQDMHVSLVGKSDAAIRSELSQAAKLVCQDVSVADYAPCVTETYRKALNEAAKIKVANK
jgi:hypothetical protein